MEEQLHIANEPDYDYGGIYTYADYLKWTVEDRIELIKGRIFKMSPAPNRNHQAIATDLTYLLNKFLWKKQCQLFVAPFDVRLPRTTKEDKDVTTVVQPDLCVICDPSKLDHRGCIGAPDLVVEILSPSNNKKELRNKFEVYEESGVRQYWIVYPYERIIDVYTLGEDGKYGKAEHFLDDDVLTTSILPGLEISLIDVFRD